MKKLAILGSTGSIGKSTLQIVSHLPEDFKVVALSAHSNLDLLEEQILEYKPEIVCITDEKKALEFKKRALIHNRGVKLVAGKEGLDEVASYQTADMVVMAIVGLAALGPTLAAIKCGKQIALASKEVLVSAGSLVMNLAKKNNVSIIPIDSEHSAIFQCLEGRDPQTIRRVVLTASGGPFRQFSEEQLSKVTLEQALNHPTWKMGPKVTVDSSTLMNKGLEVIEAHYLFDIPAEKLEVVIHPQSVVHSLVEFIDGSMLCQMSEPNMIFPIQYALTYPGRKQGLFAPFDFIKNSRLEFYPPDDKKFPSLAFASKSLKLGKSLPCYLNAANEVLVERFLNREFSWMEIGKKMAKLLEAHQPIPATSLESVLEIDALARSQARKD